MIGYENYTREDGGGVFTVSSLHTQRSTWPQLPSDIWHLGDLTDRCAATRTDIADNCRIKSAPPGGRYRGLHLCTRPDVVTGNWGNIIIMYIDLRANRKIIRQ